MHTLRDVEIFSTGTWRPSSGGTIVVTERDLDDMVGSWQAFSQVNGRRPVLKLGHKETHAWFGGDKGSPCLGFVENVRRAGNRVIADFVNVPGALFDLIKAGRYTQVSVEYFSKYDYAGSTFKNLLTAVAILGTEWPAVAGLKDLRDALLAQDALPGSGETLVILTEKEGRNMFTQEQLDKAVAEAVKAAQEAAGAAAAALKTSTDATIAQLTARAETAEGALQKFTAEQRDTKIVALVDKAITAGQWLPVARERLLAVGRGMAAVAKFGAAGKDGVEEFETFCADLPKVVEVGKETGAASKGESEQHAGENPTAKLAAMQTRLVAEGKAKDHGEAYRMALAALDPADKDAYFRQGA